MNILKRILITISAILIAVYLLLYLALPYILNKKDYSQLLTQNIKKQTGLLLYIHNYRLSVSPMLDIRLKADEIQLFYPDKKQITDLKKADIDISTLYLLKKEIRLSSIKADEFQFSTKLLKNGKTTFQEYLDKNLLNQKSEFCFSKKHPNINIKSYTIKIKDEESGQKFKIKGNNLKAKQSLDFRNMNIETNGSFYCFDKKYIDYQTRLSVPSVLFETAGSTIFDISFDELYKYDFYASVKMDLKIHEKDKKFDYVSGKADIDNFSLKIGSHKLPPSFFHMTLDKGKAALVSKFYTNKNESADINASIKLTKPYEIEMRCICPKADIANLQKIAVPILGILKIKNNLSEFTTSGSLSADFNLKTNLKTIQSKGSLTINKAAIAHKNIPLKINGINALVDFSDNSINIKKSNILVNSQPLTVHGSIDKNAIADIIVTAQNLDLNHIMNAFPVLKPQKNITIQTGKVSFKALIKGKLSEITPLINANITNFSAKELTNSIKIAVKEIIVDASTNKNKYSGKIKIKDFLCLSKSIPNSDSAIRAQEITAGFDDKNLTLTPSKINAGNAKLTVEVEIKNYLKNPSVSLSAQGSVDTALLKSFIQEDTVVYAKGYLPVKAQINSDLKNTELNIKLLTNPTNYITPIIIKSFENTNTLTNIRAKLNNNTITIEDASIYYAGNLSSLLKEINPLKLKKAASITGQIKDINTSPVLNELHLRVPSDLILTIPQTNGGTALLNADIKVSGNIQKPVISGSINLNDLKIPSYFVNAPAARITLNNNNITVQLNSIKIRDMVLSLLAQAPADFMTTNKINYVKINAGYIDLDYLMSMMSLLPQSQYAPGSDFPYIITSGDLSIKSFKTGDISAQNIKAKLSSQKNILYIKNLFADAYAGKAAANITYNFPYTSIHADIQGRGMDAGLAGKDFLPSEQGLSGKLDFDASIDMMGTTQKQQLKTLKGRADVLIRNGRLGQLGRFEHFLYAQNLLSQRLIYASLNSAKQAISPKDTGNITYLKGMLKFSGGYAHINPALTAGPQMSMYITGRTSLLRNEVDLQILGKISSDVSGSTGILGSMTIKDFLDSHTKYGPAVANLFNFCNTELPEVDISKIPALNPDYKYQTKNFQVIISGDPNSVKAVKSFTWVNPPGTKEKVLTQKVKEAINTALPSKKQQESTPSAKPAESAQPAIQDRPVPTKTTPDFLDKIPDDFNQ